MRLAWLAGSWLIGILTLDWLCQATGIEQPVIEQAPVVVYNQSMTIGAWLSLLRNVLIGLAVLGASLAALFSVGQNRQYQATRLPDSQNHLVTFWLCVMMLALGGLRYHNTITATTPQSIWQFADQGELMVQGTIQADPRRDEEGQQVILQTAAARTEQTAAPVEGLLLLKLPPYPAHHYGQRLVVMGKIRRPPGARHPGTFDYRAYLARKGIFAMMNEPVVQTLPGNDGHAALVALLAFRDRCQNILLRELPEPEASVAVGILLGLKATIPEQVYTTFSKVGTTHLLVISGWHLTIVASVFATMAQQMHWGKKATFWTLLGAIWLYTLFVGMSASVLRAAVMASLTVLAQATERKTHPWILLLTASLLLTLINPQMLWSLGFQLSVLATASLFAFAKPIQQWLQFHLKSAFWQAKGLSLNWFIEPLGITLAAQVLTMPIILYHFGNLSIVSPLANIVLVPAMPYAMLFSAIALGTGILWLPAGQFLASVLAWLPLAWLTNGAHWLATLPWAAVTLPPFPIWLVLSYYGIVIGWWLWRMWAAQPEETSSYMTVG
jgi:competence protein ComEC